MTEETIMEVKYVCMYCKPAYTFKKQLKLNELGTLIKGQVIICPQCTNFIPTSEFK